MRLSMSVAGCALGYVLLTLQGTSAAHGGSGMNSGVNNTSMMAVMRERQEKIKTCARLHSNFDSGSMTYIGPDGRRHSCP